VKGYRDEFNVIVLFECISLGQCPGFLNTFWSFKYESFYSYKVAAMDCGLVSVKFLVCLPQMVERKSLAGIWEVGEGASVEAEEAVVNVLGFGQQVANSAAS
jgi:hypothetical protein